MKPVSSDPEIVNIETPIESIPKATWSYVSKKYAPKTFKTTLLFIAAGVAIALTLGPGFLVIIVSITLGVVYAKAYRQIDNRFYEQVAQNYGYIYEPNGYLETLGRVFKIGDHQKFEDIISGTFENHPLKLFAYSFEAGSGKNRSRHKLSICELTFPTKMPNLVLNAKNFSSYSLFDFKLDKLKLEGDFHKYFTLYCEPDYEIEALQIFTPDVMQDFINQSRAYDVEFIEDRVYIMSPRSLKTRDEISSMFKFAHYLISKLKAVLPKIKR